MRKVFPSHQELWNIFSVKRLQTELNKSKKILPLETMNTQNHENLILGLIESLHKQHCSLRGCICAGFTLLDEFFSEFSEHCSFSKVSTYLIFQSLLSLTDFYAPKGASEPLCFVCASVVSYLAFVLSLFLPHRDCRSKAVLLLWFTISVIVCLCMSW